MNIFVVMKYSPGHERIEKILAHLITKSLLEGDFLDNGTLWKELPTPPCLLSPAMAFPKIVLNFYFRDSLIVLSTFKWC